MGRMEDRRHHLSDVLFGAAIGRHARVMPSARVWAPWNLSLGEDACLGHDVDCYCVAPVSVGAHATVSQYTFLCTATHDPADAHMRLQAAPIVVEDQAWICADVFVGPGVTIGENAVVTAARDGPRGLGEVCP